MAEVGRNADNDEKCIYMKMPTIIQLTKAIMKMKTDNARRLAVRTCGLVLMSMATAMSLWLRSPRSYISFIIIIITKLNKS